MGRRRMRIVHSTIVRSLITFVITGCGTGSGLIGIATGGGGNNGGNTAPVLGFFVQPNTAIVGQVISPPVEVLAKDSLGNADSTFTGAITVSIASSSAGGSLSGTTTQRAVSGIASFGNLAIDRVGTYTLSATASGASVVTSAAFTVTTQTGP